MAGHARLGILRWPAVDMSKILLIGISGRDQCLHRSLYFTMGVGSTFVDSSKSWPFGSKDIYSSFRHVDLNKLRMVPILAREGGGDKRTMGSEQTDEGTNLAMRRK